MLALSPNDDDFRRWGFWEAERHKGRALLKWDQCPPYERGSRENGTSATWGCHEKSATPNGSSPECASSLQKCSKCLLFISHPACGVWHSSLSTLRQTMCSYWLLNWTLKFCDIKMPIYCWGSSSGRMRFAYLPTPQVNRKHADIESYCAISPTLWFWFHSQGFLEGSWVY